MTSNFSGFQACLLDSPLFTHEAHLRFAWLCINKYGTDAAVEYIRRALQKYTASLGAAEKYNDTVTVAAVKAVDHFMRRSDTKSFEDFMAENPRLKTGFKKLLSIHYRTDIFKSAVAKEKYLEPELLPFD